ncbi:MAG TPA: S8 family serine peptidase, partial [Pyrinomonadaceae bacterium]|nr:S8 family serine peptidase [Pyrinomonadaceae bacterium]
MKLSHKPRFFLSRTISLTLLLSFLITNAAAGRSNVAETAAVRSAITASALTTDLTQLGREGRLRESLSFEKDVMRLIEVLEKGGSRQPVLVDEKGESQDVIVEQLAIRIANGAVPDSLKDKRIVKLETDVLFSNANSQAELTNNVNKIVDEAVSSNRSVILFVNELTNFIGSDRTNSNLAAALRSGKLSIIGGSSKAAYSQKIEPSPELSGLFQPIETSGTNLTGDSQKQDVPPSEKNTFRGDNVSADLREMIAKDSSNRLDVILQAKDADNAALRSLLKDGKANISARVGNSDTLVVDLPLSSVEALSTSGLVNYISPDRKIKSLGHIENTTGAAQMRSQPNGYGRSAYALDGSGVGIAVLDSGVFASQHSFTDGTGASRVVYSQSFVPGVTSTEDDYGHGTHVASIAAGSASRDGAAYEGIAPKANIVNLKVLDANGVGSTSALLNALNWVIQNRTAYNIRVVNISLGTPSIDTWTNDPLCRKVQDLNYYGILVVAAAGNNGKTSTGQ